MQGGEEGCDLHKQKFVWAILSLFLGGCKFKNRDVGSLLDDNLPITTKLPDVRLANPPQDSNANTVKSEVIGENAAGYRYAFVTEQPPQPQDIAVTLFSNKDFVSSMLEQDNDHLINTITSNVSTMQKLKNVMGRIIANKNFVAAIIQADGIDIATVLPKLTSLMADINKLATVPANKKEALQNKIFNTFKELSANKNLVAAVTSAMIKEREFFAQVLREEKLISTILSDEELVAEIMKFKEGKIIGQIIAIPEVLLILEEIIADLLENEEFLQTLIEPDTSKEVHSMLMNILAFTQASQKKKKVPAEIKKIKTKIFTSIEKLANNRKLMAIIFATLMNEINKPAVAYDPCQDAVYSSIQDISKPITLSNLEGEGTKTICVKGVNAEGKEQESPTVHEWEKTEIPSVLLEGLPETRSASDQVHITAKPSDDSLVGYRYQVLSDITNCPPDPASYTGNVISFDTKITDRLDIEGVKILCIFGVDKDHSPATVIVSHGWNYAKNRVAQGLPRMYIKVLVDENNSFYAGDKNVKEIPIENHGGGTLHWHATVANNISWLEIKKESGSYISVANTNDASSQLGFIRGMVTRDTPENLQLRLAGPDDMSWGKPYYREGTIEFYNSNSYFRVKSVVRLFIPKLRLSAKNLYLSPTDPSGSVDVTNIGSGEMKWKVVPLPAKKNWINYFIHTSPSDPDRISFQIDSKQLPSGSNRHVQRFAVFSNGDSTGAKRCLSSVARNFVGSNHVTWNTGDCHDLTVVYTEN